MHAEVIVSGSEMLLGELIDTNSAKIALALREIGLNLYYKTTVGDNELRMAGVLRTALDRSDVIITSGGLGPTVDDITREAVTRATGWELVFVPELFTQIEERFRRYGRKMPANNRRQAYIPAGAIPIENPVGTAPSFVVEIGQKCIISLPGVPHELEYQLEHAVLPYLRQRYDLHQVIVSRTLKVAGLGESQIDTMIGEELLTGSNPTVGLNAHSGQVDVRITAKAGSREEAHALIAPVEAAIRSQLGEAVFAVGSEASLEHVVLDRLKATGQTLITAESGTGGLLASRLAAAAEDQPQFAGGLIAGSGGLRPLGLPALSPTAPSAIELVASHIRQQYHTGFGLVAVVRRDDTGRPNGGVIALATAGKVESRELGYGGHPDLAAQWLTNAALDAMRRWM